MKLQQSTLFQIRDWRKSLGIFYLVILCITLFSFVVGAIAPQWRITSNGMEMASLIFLFVGGLNAFTENFSMLMQNGVTRKCFFVGHLLAGVIISLTMAVIDRIILLVSYFLSGTGSEVGSLFDTMYLHVIESPWPFPNWLNFLGGIGYYLMFPALGFCIVLLYKRMNKFGRIAVSVGVPVFFAVVLPILDEMVFGEQIFWTIFRALDFVFGISASAPMRGLLSTLLITAVLDGLAWLMLRRMPLKK